MSKFEDLFHRKATVGGAKKSSENQIRISLSTEKTGKVSMAFTIGKELMQQMRWVAGDYVAIDLDCPRSECVISRVPEKANRVKWQLCCSTKDKAHKGFQPKGVTARCRFSITTTPTMLKAFGMDDTQDYIPEAVLTASSGLIFPLRKQWSVLN